MTNVKPILGIIGGSGVYEIDGLQNTRWEKVSSSFGEPSDSLFFGELDGQKLVFLPRHGRGHRIPPSEINYRANIDSLKRAGVTDVISVSAVGSLKEDLKPGMFMIVDQFIDRTFARRKSFFGPGLVAHVSMADPVCNRLGNHLEHVAKKNGINPLDLEFEIISTCGITYCPPIPDNHENRTLRDLLLEKGFEVYIVYYKKEDNTVLRAHYTVLATGEGL